MRASAGDRAAGVEGRGGHRGRYRHRPRGGGPRRAAADWQADLAQNLTSVFHSLKFEIPAIAAAGGGSIVNNASIGGSAA
jgi:hypothetical protein